MKPKILILTGYGINAEKELKWAFDLAGGQADIDHLEDLIENKNKIFKYQILAFPGGFSFGDHLGSGRVFANIIKHHLLDEINHFIQQDKLIIGICNGFQILTGAGLIPALDDQSKLQVALINNDSGHFENRWVWCKIENSACPWLDGLSELYLPVRHGEGKLITNNDRIYQLLKTNKQIALTYFKPGFKGKPVPYPDNPNGAEGDIAGLTSFNGRILGLMPHPEAYIFAENHPNWTEGKSEKQTGLDIFKNGIKYFL